MKVTQFKVEGNELRFPSYAGSINGIEGVEGLQDQINEQIAEFNQDTLAPIFNQTLPNTYLGKNAKAVDSAKADYATAAGKATLDGDGKNIAATYYKKTDTVAKASADAEGNNFVTAYAKQTGTYSSMSVGKATNADNATKAVVDSAGNTISSYLKSAQNTVDGGDTYILFEKGNGQTFRVLNKDTTYAPVTGSANGLMTPAMLQSLQAAASGDVSISGKAASAYTADSISGDVTVSIGGAVEGKITTFRAQKGATYSISTDKLDMSKAKTGTTLAVANGGTGQSNLDNVTVGKAKQFATSPTITFTGALTNTSFTLAGNTNVTCTAGGINVGATGNTGTLPITRGGTGNSNGYAAGLQNSVKINGVNTQLTQDSSILFAGVCNTEAGAAEKTVSIPGFTLIDNVIIAVYFKYQNTAEQPTLNVNSTGAQYIRPQLYDYIRTTGGSIKHVDFTPANGCVTFFQYRASGSDAGWYIIRPMIDKLATARSIALSGAVTGTATNFDGSANISIPTTALNMNTANSGILGTAYGGTGNSDGTVARLTTPRSINGVNFDGSKHIAMHGLCSTASNVAEKVVTIPYCESDIPNVFCVRFAHANTADNPKLNVNNTGALPIYRGITLVTKASDLTTYDYQWLWFQNTNINSQSCYCIVNPPVHTIEFTGDITASVDLGADGTISIPTTVDQTKGFSARTTTSNDSVYGGDLNNYTNAGMFRLPAAASGSSWHHYPQGFLTNKAHYMQVIANTSNNTVIQLLFAATESVMWMRNVYDGQFSAANWVRMSTVDCNTVE